MELVTFVTLALLAGADPTLKNCEAIGENIVKCEQVPTEGEYQFGTKKVKVVDVNKLFDEAKKKQTGSGFKRIGLWDYHDYPPFIVELARQNNMDPGYLIDWLAEEDVEPNPWRALQELEVTYEAAVRSFGRAVVDEAFEKIMVDIIEDVLAQINLSLELENV